VAEDRIRATLVIEAPVEAVFDVLADPSKHAAIDGTGRVQEALDPEPLTAVGQVFRVAMFHENHPDGTYRMGNRVQVLERPRTIAWEPGHYPGDGSLRFSGWSWRYDLEPLGPSSSRVTLTYDWAAVEPDVRAEVGFPPFPPEHLDRSLAHLAELAR
jgi:uncharacterized protein YndB with AHSA1/START domain